MVNGIVLLCMAISFASSGGAAFMSGTIGGSDRSTDKARLSTEDRELTEDEFDSLERLKDNAIDPRKADLDALLSIPDFPERLAKRVIEANRGVHSGGKWIDRLTPPEIEELYRYRDYLVVPEKHLVRLKGSITEDRIASGAGERREGRISLSASGLNALWRGRYSEEAHCSVFYLSAQAHGGFARIHAGSFVPDLAMGLLFGSCSPSYLFSGTYPFHAPRSIAGSTSFYGPTVFGGAVELWYRRAWGVFFLGRPRTFRSTRFELGAQPLLGGRLAVRLREGEIGFSGFHGASESGKMTYTIDGAWSFDAVRIGFELGITGEEAPACLWGLSYRTDRTRMGFLLHSIPPEVAGTFGRVNGRALGAEYQHTGATMVIEHELLPHFHARAAVDRYYRTAGYIDESKNVMKVECERRWRRLLLRLSWSSSIGKRERVIPYPAQSEPTVDRTGSLGLSSTFRIARGAVVKLSLRGPVENGVSGLLFSPAVSLRFFSGRFQASASGMFYRVFEGRPVCYYYEPSLAGIYPWRAASSNKERCSFVTSYSLSKLDVSCKTELEKGKPCETSFQAAFDF
jgi:hypothetical protein